jgi:hypothetical protein
MLTAAEAITTYQTLFGRTGTGQWNNTTLGVLNTAAAGLPGPYDCRPPTAPISDDQSCEKLCRRSLVNTANRRERVGLSWTGRGASWPGGGGAGAQNPEGNGSVTATPRDPSPPCGRGKVDVASHA